MISLRSWKTFSPVQLIVMSLLIVATIAGFVLVSTSQEIRQQASGGNAYASCAQGVEHGKKACDTLRSYVTCQNGSFVNSTQCGANQTCQGGNCVGEASDKSCAGGIPHQGTSCDSNRSYVTCQNGSFVNSTQCGANQTCQGGKCVAEASNRSCAGGTPHQGTSCDGQRSFVVCTNGSFGPSQACPSGQMCEGGSCKAVAAANCSGGVEHGKTACRTSTTLVTCNNGSFVSPTECNQGSTCRNGECQAINPTPIPTPVPTPNIVRVPTPIPTPIALAVPTPIPTPRLVSAPVPTPNPGLAQQIAQQVLNPRPASTGLNPVPASTGLLQLATPTPTSQLNRSGTSTLPATQPASQCYFGTSTCSQINRYPGSSCNYCPSGVSACCGDLIPASAKVCNPGASICSGTTGVSVCNSSGTEWLTVPCRTGTQCTGNRCIDNSRCTPNTCNDGKWCGEDGVPTSLSCDTGKACGLVRDGACNPHGYRCVNGRLWRGNGCADINAVDPRAAAPAEVVEQQASLPEGDRCYFGGSTCSSFNRYPGTACSSSCPGGVSACCGGIIPASAKVCTPGEVTCQNNLVKACKSDGLGYLERACDIGSVCQAGRCVQQTDPSACTCSARVLLSTGYENVTRPVGGTFTGRINECYRCVGTDSTCRYIESCGGRALAPEGSAAVEVAQSIRQQHPNVAVYGSGSGASYDSLLPVQTTLNLLPSTLTYGQVYILGEDNSGGGVNYNNGAYIELGAPGCDPDQDSYTQNPDVRCGYAISIAVHETLHSHDGRDICNASGCTTAEEAFVQASAQDGVQFVSEINATSTAGGTDFLLYSQYDTTSAEGYAISGAAYVLAPDTLREEQPHVYEFFRTQVFEGREYIEIPNESCDGTTRIVVDVPGMDAVKQVNQALCANN